jgi:hypothetical protein
LINQGTQTCQAAGELDSAHRPRWRIEKQGRFEGKVSWGKCERWRSTMMDIQISTFIYSLRLQYRIHTPPSDLWNRWRYRVYTCFLSNTHNKCLSMSDLVCLGVRCHS